MAKFIVEINEGWTKCKNCPFMVLENRTNICNSVDCSRYDLSTLKIIEKMEE